MIEGTFMYAAPMSPDDDRVVPVYSVPVPDDTFKKIQEHFKQPKKAEAELREQLNRIESKLDELLKRTAPEKDLVEDIRKRVNEAIDRLRLGAK